MGCSKPVEHSCIWYALTPNNWTEQNDPWVWLILAITMSQGENFMQISDVDASESGRPEPETRTDSEARTRKHRLQVSSLLWCAGNGEIWNKKRSDVKCAMTYVLVRREIHWQFPLACRLAFLKIHACKLSWAFTWQIIHIIVWTVKYKKHKKLVSFFLKLDRSCPKVLNRSQLTP